MYKVSIQNELQYKRLEIEKLQEDHIRNLKDVKLKYEDKLSQLSKELLSKESEIDQFNQKIADYQQKVRDF